MKLPGFTATKALYKIGQPYQMVGSLTEDTGEVRPAIFGGGCSPVLNEDAYINCLMNCYQNGGSRCGLRCCQSVTGAPCCILL